MIDTGLYPVWNRWPGAEITRIIYQIGIEDPEFSPAYWIGWVSWDDFPDTLRLSRAERADDGTLSFTDCTRPENIDMLYGCVASTTSSPQYTVNTYYKYNGDIWYNWSIDSNFVYTSQAVTRLFNKIDININLYKLLILQFCYELEGKCYISEAYPNVIDVVSGTFTATAYVGETEPQGLIGETFSVSQADITGEIVTRTINGHTVRIFLQAFKLADPQRTIKPDGTGNNYIYPKPVFRVHDDEDRPYLLGAVGDGLGGLSSSYGFYGAAVNIRPDCTFWGRYIHDTTGAPDIIPGGLMGSVTPEDVAPIGNTYSLVDISGANFCAVGVGRDDFLRLVRKLTMDDIKKIMSLQMRLGSADAENTYDNGEEKYYPLVVNGQFMCELINGARDRDRLQDWQRVGTVLDPESNDYTEADKPIYIPPDPDERDKIGDSIGFNRNIPGGTATGLYTMYALRQAHVSNLGAALWTSFNTPNSNFWQNVRMAAGLYEESGSFDLSAILDYITSIRIYPFALINLPGFSGAGTGSIRMGTGKIPLDLSTGGAGNVGIMGSYTGIIDAGSVTVPIHYDDFRDLEGVTMSVYLPYIGNVSLNSAEVAGQTIQATYAVDLTSGACVAYLLLSGRWGYYPIGVYSGTIGADIPLTASQGNRMFLRDLKNVIGLGSIIGDALSGTDVTDEGALTGAIGSGLASGAAYMAKNIYHQGMGAALTPPTLGGGGANFAGFGAPQTAYLQIRRHKYAYTGRSFPATQLGRRTSGVQYLGALSGFTVCENVDVSGIPAPADVQRDIKKMLESGVYL